MRNPQPPERGLLIVLSLFVFAILSLEVVGQDKNINKNTYLEYIKANSPQIHNGIISNEATGSLKYRLLSEYGSLWINQDTKVILPPKVIFISEVDTQDYQSKLLIDKLANSNCILQKSALSAFKQAQKKAKEKGLSITLRGTDSCLRSYTLTHKLWLSRVEPNLAFYLQKGKLTEKEAQSVRKANIEKQIVMILEIEKNKKLYFDKYRATSILNSVAAPGSSQHMSGLAVDISEYANKDIRAIMNEFGWFQTVKHDLPHFTYLGNIKESNLSLLGLKKYTEAGYTFWIPNI